jgi:hypothetical protein
VAKGLSSYEYVDIRVLFSCLSNLIIRFVQCVIALSSKKSIQQRTEKKKSLSPVWNESFTFDVSPSTVV